MYEIKWKPSDKQKLAFDILNDRVTTELFYGGGAGGGKSYLGCAWLIYVCAKYPGSRWLMGRAVLKSLKESTLLTLLGILKEWGFKKDREWKYNSIEGTIRFSNGSEIYLKDLYAYPSDPEFDSLGSTEFTGAFIDECSQVTSKAKNIVMSRLRYKLEEFNLIPKLFMASNPSKNFLYYEFYKPWKNKTLIKFRRFIPALVQDNPFISPYYIENLKKLDKVSKERLLYGNFEYDNDPARMFDYDKVLDMFTLRFSRNAKSKLYLTVDVARFGRDKTVIMLWTDLMVDAIRTYDKTSVPEVVRLVENIAKHYSIPRSQIVIDEDGIGGGVVDLLPGVKGFVGGSSPTESKTSKLRHNFKNKRAQCYFTLAEHVNNSKIGIMDIDEKFKEEIIKDLEQIKAKDIDKDTKLTIISKENIKEHLGRSSDYSDTLMMRMYFEVMDNTPKGMFII